VWVWGGAAAAAGTIKSGGKTRRAAKMVVLNVDHPDVRDFIWCKAREERKARVLRDAGFDMDLDGRDSISIQYQNANNSVRVNDDFMRAFETDTSFDLKAVLDGRSMETLPARDLMREIAQAAWECADPGMQYDTTINDWHTTPESGRINASNPCFTGETLVHTDKGLIRFDELARRAVEGETFGIYTHDATNPDAPAETVTLSSHEAVMVTGTNPVVRLRFSNGAEVRCTPNHRFWTANRGWVAARDLESTDRVRLLDRETPATAAERRLPVPTDVAAYASKGDHAALMALPEKWDEDFAHLLGWLVGDGSFSGDVISAIYGSAEDREVLLPRHQRLFADLNGGRSPNASIQANGTVQLRRGQSSRHPRRRSPPSSAGCSTPTGRWSISRPMRRGTSVSAAARTICCDRCRHCSPRSGSPAISMPTLEVARAASGTPRAMESTARTTRLPATTCGSPEMVLIGSRPASASTCRVRPLGWSGRPRRRSTARSARRPW
jgi:ribonucleoside-diphosphate reductase alpha chain